jgi:site-specific recombinase XerD
MEEAMTARVEEARGTGLVCVVDDAGPVEEINAFLHAVTTRGLSPLTVRAYAFDLAAAYRWMAAAGRTPLSGEQVRAFLRSLRHYRDIAMVHLMLLCGLRSREVLGLGLGDVSLLDRWVRVMGKGAKERVVPLADLAAMSVEQYFKHERPGVCTDDILFVCLKGERRGLPMTPAGLRSIFRSRRKSGALANANPHRFRHTFGADMARSGVSLSVMQRLMGHANPEQTLQYINLSMTDVADAYRAAVAEIQKRYDPEVQDDTNKDPSAQAREDLPRDP